MQHIINHFMMITIYIVHETIKFSPYYQHPCVLETSPEHLIHIIYVFGSHSSFLFCDPCMFQQSVGL